MLNVIVPTSTTAPSGVRRLSSETRIVLILIAVTAALRVGIASVGSFGPDEAYMVSNARVFAFGYLDHPPLHVWLAGAMAKLTGSEDPLLVRLPFIALFAASTWLMYRLTAGLFGARAGLWAALFLNLAPVFTIAHATWVLPDGPLIFFMLAGATIVARILFGEPPYSHPTLAWIAAGLCGGLACLSKFHGAFFFFAVLVFLLSVRPQRHWLATLGPWLGVLAAAMVFWPAIFWNVHHGFENLSFQAGRLFGQGGPTWHYLPESIGGQFAYLTPWLIVPLGYYLGRALWRGPSMPKTWFLGLLAIGPIVVFTTTAFIARSLPHWPMPGWIFTFPLMGQGWVALEQRRPKSVYAGLVVAAAVLVAFAGLAEVQVATGAIGRAVPALFKPHDPTLDLLPWDGIASALTERHLIDADTPAVAGLNWIEASKINVAVGKTVPVLCLCDSPQGRSFWRRPEAYVGRNVILVGTPQMISNPSRRTALAARFGKLEALAPIILRRGGEPALELMLFRGVDLKG